jgi:long-subunit acyl-CoA synthetase (AMP-forming)
MSAAFADTQRTLTSEELITAEQQASAWLAKTPDASVRYGLFADNGIAWAIVDRALHRGSFVNVPLPRHFSEAQLAHVVEDADLDRIMTDDPHKLYQLPGDWRRIDDGILGLQCWARSRPSEQRRLGQRRIPPDTCKVTYTSGSTGNPKGVCLSRASMDSVVHSLVSVLRPLTVRRHLSLLPLSTLLDNLVSLQVAPALGATVSLPSLGETGVGYGGIDIPRMLACVDRYSPESLLLVPELLRVLVASVAKGWRAPANLKFIAVGGASVSPELLTAAHAVGLPAYEGYGLSECASVVALNCPGAARHGSVGRVLPHARVRIDEAGEIYVRGATMSGYLGADERVNDEVATGDLGFIDADGFLHVRGRRKNLLITSLGRNVSPEWVERELLASGSIGQAVVFGESKPFLSCLIYPSSPMVNAAELGAAIDAANRHLPDYAQVRRWALLPQPLRLADETVTANGRTRRDVVFSRYQNLIEDMYVDAIAS